MSYDLEKERNLNLKNKSLNNDFRGKVKILKPVFFSGSKSQNDKVSVLIGKIISWSFQGVTAI